MEDGPEEAEGTYEHAGHSYRLREEESEKWRVLDGDRYLGVLIAVRGSDGPAYTLDFAGEEDKYDEPAADDWRLVLEYLIDHSTPSGGR